MSFPITLTDDERTVGLNTGTPDEHHSTGWFDVLSGWDAPDETLSTLDPTSEDGTRVTGHRYNGRSVVVGGIFTTTTEENAFATYNDLLRLLRKGNTILMQVNEPTPKRLLVTRGAAPKIDISPGVLTYQFTLLAQNPAKFAATEKSVTIAPGASAVITNTGTADSSYWHLTGAGTGVLDVRIGQRRMATGTSTITNPVLDRQARSVIGGGINRFGLLTTDSQWLVVASGPNTVVNAGTIPVTLGFRDAWE